MAFSISLETPLQDDVRGLVKQLNDFLNPLSPPEFQFQMTVEQMADSETSLFVARDAQNKAVGMGALKLIGEIEGGSQAEVKRMFAHPNVRGQGLGSQLLQSIEDLAREKGVERLKLETGPQDSMAGAHKLYRNHGFTACGPFLDYPESEYSFYYEKRLDAAQTQIRKV